MNTYNLTVFLEDTDAGGIVYHAKYLHFMERCRTLFFYHKGVDHSQLIRSEAGHFVVKKIAVNFTRPAKLGDNLKVTLDVVEIRGASIICDQKVVKPYLEEELEIANARVIIVFVDKSLHKPIRIPASIKDKIQKITN